MAGHETAHCEAAFHSWVCSSISTSRRARDIATLMTAMSVTMPSDSDLILQVGGAPGVARCRWMLNAEDVPDLLRIILMMAQDRSRLFGYN
jgi:hypothetical protein